VGRHGVVTEIDEDTDTFATIRTPEKSFVQPSNYGKYIKAYRVAAQEDWGKRIGQRVRRFVRKHPPLARSLRSTRSQFRRFSKSVRRMFT
jgi:hypothetical protein